MTRSRSSVAAAVRTASSPRGRAMRGRPGIVIAENRPGDPTFALFSTSRWDDLRPGRLADPRGGRRNRRRRDGAIQPRDPRGADDVGGRPDELHVLRTHAFRPRARSPTSRRPAPRSSRRRFPSSRETSTRSSTARASPHRTSRGPPRCSSSVTRPGRRSRSSRRSCRRPVPRLATRRLTQEASVLVQGAGLVRVASADRPLIFTDPQSLSFGYLPANSARRDQQSRSR